MSAYLQRKRLRLENFDYRSENVCFVTVCVNQRKMILGRVLEPVSDADTPEIQLSAIGKIVDGFTATIRGIDKYVIMPNHVHMIIFNEEGELISTKIRSWKTLITKAIGEAIWQREFYDHIIRDERDYRIRWNYIDSNPSKWALDEYYQK